MPSHALTNWQTIRLPRLDRVDAQNVAIGASVPPSPDLADENLRGYVMLLSAHFQGFCRDLHSECVQAVAGIIPASVILMFQVICQQGRQLDKANAKYEGIRIDFERFDLDLTAALTTDPALSAPQILANRGHINRINHLNDWRNYAAHHNPLPPAHGGPLVLATVQIWKASCDGFATELDRIMYNQLQVLTGVAPW